MYYISFPKDRKFVKCLVYMVFLLDTVQSVLFFRDAFEIFGYGFGDMVSLKKAHLSGFSVPILTGMGEMLPPSTIFNMNAEARSYGVQSASLSSLFMLTKSGCYLVRTSW